MRVCLTLNSTDSCRYTDVYDSQLVANPHTCLIQFSSSLQSKLVNCAYESCSTGNHPGLHEFAASIAVPSFVLSTLQPCNLHVKPTSVLQAQLSAQLHRIGAELAEH